MKYLTVKDLLLLHNLAVDESGGLHGLRDLTLLESAVGRPNTTFGGQDLYPSLFDKAAALMHSLLLNHPFVDGNKRTAVFSAMTLLELNGREFIATQKELVAFALFVANSKPEIEEISLWLKKHSKKK